MKYLFLTAALVFTVGAQAGGFTSSTTNKKNEDGSVTTRTYSKGEAGSYVTKTRTSKDGKMSTTTKKVGEKGRGTSTRGGGGDHAESAARNAGASKEEAAEVGEKHRFCQQNPDHEDCKKKAPGNDAGSLYDPDGEVGEDDDPFVLQ